MRVSPRTLPIFLALGGSWEADARVEVRIKRAGRVPR